MNSLGPAVHELHEPGSSACDQSYGRRLAYADIVTYIDNETGKQHSTHRQTLERVRSRAEAGVTHDGKLPAVEVVTQWGWRGPTGAEYWEDIHPVWGERNARCRVEARPSERTLIKRTVYIGPTEDAE